MTEAGKEARRGEVLRAFHRSCAQPTAEQIYDWTVRHPEFAEDIREHAAIMRDWDADCASGDEAELNMTELDRARSAALNALHKARSSGEVIRSTESEVTFDLLIKTSGWTAPKLESKAGISREILSDLFRGRMQPPVGRRLVETLVVYFETTESRFEKALQFALGHPTLGHAKATGQPKISRRTYEEIVRTSQMSPERKAFWLEED